VDKNATDAAGGQGLVQSAQSGEGVTFFSVVPFPRVPGSAGNTIYLSSRGGGGWSTQGLLPQSNVGSRSDVMGWTEDLAHTVITAEEPLLAPGAMLGVQNDYVRDSATGTYRLLAASAAGHFADATRDGSGILFEHETAAPGVFQLYEWNNGQVSVAGVLPDGSLPVGGAVAGPGGPAILPQAPGGATSGFYTQYTISEDGSRVFFSDVGTGQIYLREPQLTQTVEVSKGTAHWRAATPDGSYAFYTEGGGLYRFNASSRAQEPLTTETAGVLGTLGVSDDGSSVYFVATGILAGENVEKHSPVEGSNNLYEWHDGKLTFIAGLSNAPEEEPNWRDYSSTSGTGPGRVGKSSLVTPDGKRVLFSSEAQLTGFDSLPANGLCDGEPRQCYELFLYDAASSHLSCVSCNPSGAGAVASSPSLTGLSSTSESPATKHEFLTRNLSDDGSRVFFQTAEALVPQDTNRLTDVYEWERQGRGSCKRSSEAFSESSGGCLYLISTGQSGEQSYFGDASSDGSDVFFFTRQSLVAQDQDNNVDVYNARENGGIEAQNPPPPPAACSAEACRNASASAPVFGALPSETSSGSGNLMPSPSTPATKPKAKPLTRAQQLARALRGCKRTPKKQRRSCEARARKRYGARSTAKRARGRAK
jgi:hypothetical protein